MTTQVSVAASSRVFGDSVVMLKRSLRHILRSPDTIITTAITPIAMLLLFVYVFGGSIDTGDGAGAGGYGTYVTYLLPGILLITIASGSSMTERFVDSKTSSSVPFFRFFDGV